ncbi:MAG TPA: PorT family protein [Bacteroidetes bacterium]|nr:PorT family protein [Bacteroidota bacterium]
MLNMKGLTHTLLVLLVVGGLASSSAFAQKGLKLGIVAFPHTTWMLNQDDLEAAQDVYKYETTFGMAAGPSVGYNFGDGIGFRLNFLYSAQGQRWTSLNSRGDVVTNNQRLHYLKVPLMLSFNTGTEFNKLIFSFQAGFQGNVLMRARYYNDDESYTPDEALFDNVTDFPTTYQRFSWLDYGPVAEIGLDIKLTYNIMANIHLRGDYSLSDAENKDASFKLWERGVPNDVRYWGNDRAVTNNLTAGIVFGLTYTFTTY